MSKCGMLRHDPCATLVLDREDDRRAMERVDQLRRDDADDAAMPAFAGDDEHRVRADVRIGLHDLLRRREDLGFLFLAAHVLAVELQRERARLLGQPLVGGEQQPRGDIGRAHAARRRSRAAPAGTRCGSCRSSCRSGPATSSSARSPTLCGPRVRRSRPIFAMTRFSPTSGTTSASVPIAASLTKPGSQLLAAGAAAERLHQLQRDADAGEVLVGIRAVVRASG